MIKKLILTRGIQGSGKSTWAKAWIAEDPEHRIRVNNDDIRNMLGSYWIPEREILVSEIKKQTVLNAMRLNYDIVVDNMNLNPKEVKYWEDIVKNYNELINTTISGDSVKYEYEIEFKDFFIPVEECIRRDAMRPNPIGEKVIKETWNRYKHFIQTTSVENYVNNLKKYTGKPKCVVIDMDSTMCFNMDKRPWFGDGAAEGMINDVPNSGMCDLIRTLQQDYTVIVATGRDYTQEEVTKEWLVKQGIVPDEYYFRKTGDYRKGVEVKKEQIESILEDYDIVAVFDDCTPIVEMYREMGLTVLQPNKGL